MKKLAIALIMASSLVVPALARADGGVAIYPTTRYVITEPENVHYLYDRRWNRHRHHHRHHCRDCHGPRHNHWRNWDR